MRPTMSVLMLYVACRQHNTRTRRISSLAYHCQAAKLYDCSLHICCDVFCHVGHHGGHASGHAGHGVRCRCIHVCHWSTHCRNVLAQLRIWPRSQELWACCKWLARSALVRTGVAVFFATTARWIFFVALVCIGTGWKFNYATASKAVLATFTQAEKATGQGLLIGLHSGWPVSRNGHCKFHIHRHWLAGHVRGALCTSAA